MISDTASRRAFIRRTELGARSGAPGQSIVPFEPT